jgi:hypothetical protein
MSANVAIPVAGFKDVYNVADVGKALQELTPSANEGLRALYEKMLRAGGQRFTVKPSSMPKMDELLDELPNFGAVLEDIRKHLALCIDSEDSVELPPTLLLGEPGIGKTHFAKRVAALLGTGFGFVPMSSLTAGWILSGASSQWKNAKPGKVFDTFLHGEYANPVMVVDEIDKAADGGQYDPLGALYALLEAHTAMQFVDEFVEIPIDASGAVWFATANDPAHPGADPQPDERLRDRSARRSGRGPDRAGDLPRDPLRARLGPAVSRDAGAARAREARRAHAARDAARRATGLRQRQARRPQRGEPGRYPGRARREEISDRFLGRARPSPAAARTRSR